MRTMKPTWEPPEESRLKPEWELSEESWLVSAPNYFSPPSQESLRGPLLKFFRMSLTLSETVALYLDVPPDDISGLDINWMLKLYKEVKVKLKKIPFVVSEGGKIMLLSYRGYNACGDIDEKTDLIKGKVIDVNDSITFEGESVKQFKQAFHDAIDSYLEFCEAENRKPDKPFSGNISYRTTKERHRALSIAAAQAGLSINALMDQIIGKTIDENVGSFRNFNSYAMN